MSWDDKWQVTLTFTLSREEITAGDWDPEDPSAAAARETREITEYDVIECFEAYLSDGLTDFFESGYVIGAVEKVAARA